tara:strand:- start:6286 stop:6636 length:351 start_codon:yes stop_codon:yes gene_type:complete
MGAISKELKNKSLLTLQIINHFRILDKEMASQTMAVYLAVASHGGEGVSMATVKDDLGIAQSSASRNINLLCKTSRHMKPGHNLLETYEDPMERRRKLCRLSPRGKLFLEQLSDLF